MNRFRKFKRRTVPSLNTSSLPDLIFTSLFFFMIVTHFRPVSVMTQLELPTATELQKLTEKSLIVHIIVGRKQEKPSSPFDIQLNSGFVDLDELPNALSELQKKVAPEDKNKQIVVMRVDKNTPMGLVGDIKKILREANLLTIHYSANKKNGKL